MMLMKYYKQLCLILEGGIFTPFIIVCHKVDRNVMDAVILSQIHPQGGGLLRC